MVSLGGSRLEPDPQPVIHSYIWTLRVPGLGVGRAWGVRAEG